MLLDLCEPGVVSAQYGVVLPRRVRPKQWFFPKSFQSRRGATKKWLLFRKTLSVTPYWSCSSAQDKEQRFLLHHFEAGLATKTTTGWRGGVAYKELFFGPAKDGPEKQDGRRK